MRTEAGLLSRSFSSSSTSARSHAFINTRPGSGRRSMAMGWIGYTSIVCRGICRSENFPRGEDEF